MLNSKRKNYKLQVASYKLHESNGFTLMELLLTMAIIAILAGAILVSLSSQRKKANQGKMLAEFSGVIQPILMCKSDNENIREVVAHSNGGTPICAASNSYGYWPSLSDTDFAHSAGGTGYMRDGDFDDGSWYFYIDDGNARICCNNASSKCQMLDNGATCNASTPAQ